METHFEQYFVDPAHVSATSFFLQGSEFDHAAKVKRKRVGEKLAAVDGAGNKYTGIIKSIGKNQLVVEIDHLDKDAGEPKLQLVIAQAVPKGPQFDLVIEKGTEIGVSVFQPILTEYSIVNPAGRLERWQQKALAAMKQCGRSRCPQILPPVNLAEAFSRYADCTSFIVHPFAGYDAAAAPERVASGRNIVLYVGPEGGFTDVEFALAIKEGIVPLSLGVRRLRSETAGLAAAVQVLTWAGELGSI
jgi:16S rRNA (uracil1498-N3)-methyltransferase